ncbi:MobF family relaxase [Nocardiopsis dassonvillei]|uniref:MobF family relaxase n=1 Tax=Nocardiopsis dassonvillei TaxID=2014 RepID=UPI00366C9995
MYWTDLGADLAQVIYRLAAEAGCDPNPARQEPDAQLDYRLKNADRPIVRIGTGWREFGIEPGTPLRDQSDYDGVISVMSGRDPRTNKVLVKPKMAVAPKAKLTARPLIDAIEAIAEAAHASPEDLLAETDSKAVKRFVRMRKMYQRDGEAHRVPVKDLERIADAAGVALGMLYDADELKTANEHAEDRVRVGKRGWDGVPNVPGSIKVLLGVVEQEMADAIEEEYLATVGDTLPTLQEWTAYGMAGHHGDGQTAERVATSGFIGTMTEHFSARPVDGEVGDPHLHVHLMIAHLVRCADGEWRTVAAGGRDLMRHTAAYGELFKARFRDRLTRRFGVRWVWSEHSGEWEIEGITPEMIATFSRRSAQIATAAGAEATVEQKRAAARSTAHAKQQVTAGDMRSAWHARAEEAGIDRARLVAEVTGRGPDGDAPSGPRGGPGPQVPDPEQVAEAVWDPETGVTSHSKVITRAKVLAAVAAACPGGVPSAAVLEELTDRVLADPRAVRLPGAGASHMANAERYTSVDVLDAEHTIIDTTTRRLGEGAARVDEQIVLASIRAFQAERGFTLSREQRLTLARLLTGGHGIDGVIGVAGAGKTTIMAAAKAAWETAGFTVAGASTAAVAAGNLKAEAGIESRTVAGWAKSIKERTGGLAGVDVLVVDEAAMVDDRSMALIIAEADRAGTKIVGIGDPQQFPAIGIGGGFKRIHEIVKGAQLSENRRQREEVDRQTLEVWRQGGRRTALSMWGERGMVQAPPDAPAAFDQIAAAWRADRAPITDEHEAIANVLVMAAYNADVRQLNARCRAAARADGLLGEEEGFRVAGGGRLHLAVGDQVRITRNDYRSRRKRRTGPPEPDVLNGFRGIVREVDRRRGALVEWRFAEQTQQAWIDPAAIGRGDLVHGYAMTIAGAQGLSCQRAHIYGYGADAHSLYPGMTRAKAQSTLYLPTALLESEEMRLSLGPARTPQEQLARVVSCYAATLTDEDEGMVLDQIEPPAVEAAVPASAPGPVLVQPVPAADVPQAAAESVSAPEALPMVTLSREQALAGQGPAATAAADTIARYRAQAAEEARRAGELRRELESLDGLRQASRWVLLRRGTSRGAVEQQWARASAELVDALARQERAQAAAVHVQQKAVEADVAQARAEQVEVERAARERRVLQAAAELGVSREQAGALPEWMLDPAARRAMQASRGGSTGGGGPASERDHVRGGRGSEGPELG